MAENFPSQIDFHQDELSHQACKVESHFLPATLIVMHLLIVEVKGQRDVEPKKTDDKCYHLNKLTLKVYKLFSQEVEVMKLFAYHSYGYLQTIFLVMN